MTSFFRGVRHVMGTPEGLLGIILCAVIAIVTLVGPFVTPFDPTEIDLLRRLQSPSTTHWFGTDDLGRDLFSRVLDGAPRTVVTSILVVAASALVGSVVGVVAGYLGGWPDRILMRITDVFVGYPALLLAVAVAASMGGGLLQAGLALGIVWWAGYARLMRGQAAAVANLPYIDASRIVGASGFRIMRDHVLPNSLGPLVVKLTLDVGLIVESVAALGFIGLGAQAPDAEWGAMIAASRTFADPAWWYPAMPGIALLLVVVGTNLLGDGLARSLDQSAPNAVAKKNWGSIWRLFGLSRSTRERG